MFLCSRITFEQLIRSTWNLLVQLVLDQDLKIVKIILKFTKFIINISLSILIYLYTYGPKRKGSHLERIHIAVSLNTQYKWTAILVRMLRSTTKLATRKHAIIIRSFMALLRDLPRLATPRRGQYLSIKISLEITKQIGAVVDFLLRNQVGRFVGKVPTYYV